MIYIGIDPGKNGGIAILSDTNDDIFSVNVLSEDVLLGLLSNLNPNVCRCVLEKVNAMPGQGVVSMFSFGQNYGFIQGVLRTLSIPFELVPPAKWKKEFSVTHDKNTSIEVARRLFPMIDLRATPRCKKEHDGMAEALLMAEYARRHY